MSYRSSILLVAASAALIAPPLLAQEKDETKCGTVESFQTDLESVSRSDLRDSALVKARGEALKSLLGLRVTKNDLMDKAEGQVDFRQVSNQQTNGMIVKDSIVSWKAENSGTWKMTYYGCARPFHGASSTLSLDVMLNKEAGVYLDNGVNARDEVYVRARVKGGDGYLYVFFKSGDSVDVVYPNPLFMRGPRVKAPRDTWVVVPDPMSGMAVEVALKKGRRKQTDDIYVVATTDDYPLSTGDGPNNLRQISSMSWLEFNEWLVKIPLEKQVFQMKSYEIRRTKP